MNRLGLFAYGAAIAGVALLTARETVDASIFVYHERATTMVALGVFGWFVATLGPLALSFWFWRLARQGRPQWLLHFLFVPCAVALVRAGASILFFAADVPDGDSIEGYALTAATGFLALALLVHVAALAKLGIEKLRRREGFAPRP